MNILKAVAAASVFLLPAVAGAQTYPERPVTIVVPFAPGASNDIIGRYLAEGLSKLWGQPVPVENMPGAGASTGAANVAQSEPDGYRLMFVSATLTTSAATRKMPFDPATDLAPVGMAARGANVIVTGNRIPLPSLEALIEESKKQTIFYGSTGVGSSTQFAAIALAEATGISMTPVQYAGGAPALVDLVGGRIDVYTGSALSVIPGITAGQMTPIAVSSDERVKVLPDVPTVVELGYPDAQHYTWWGVFAPAGTPPEIIEKINADMKTILDTPEAVAFLEPQGAEPLTMSVAEFEKWYLDELTRFQGIATKYGITAE